MICESIALSLALNFIADVQPDLGADSESEYAFYLSEMLNHSMPVDAPMAKLIEERLVETIFDSTDADVVKNRITALSTALKSRPELVERTIHLDRALTKAFDAKLAKAKTRRLIYAAGGAVVGALVAIPVGRLISTSAQTLWISVPAGALVGAGAGFLLGHLVEMPDYRYELGGLNWDTHALREFLSGEDHESP